MNSFDQDPHRKLRDLLWADVRKADLNSLTTRDAVDLWGMFEAEERLDRYAPQKLWHDLKSPVRWVVSGVERPFEIQLTRMAEGVWYDQAGAYYTPEEVCNSEEQTYMVSRRRQTFREKLARTDHLLAELTRKVSSIVQSRGDRVIEQIEYACRQFQERMKHEELFVPTFEMTHGSQGTHFAFSGPPNTPDYYALKYGTDVQPKVRDIPSIWFDEAAFKPKDKS